jgi:hypothetical protein
MRKGVVGLHVVVEVLLVGDLIISLKFVVYLN